MGDILRGNYGYPELDADTGDYERPLEWWHVAVLVVVGVVLWIMSPALRVIEGMRRGDRWGS